MKITRIYSMLPLLLIFAGLFTKVIADEGDEDDILGEIVADLMIGFALSVCEEFVICRAFMIAVGLTALLATIVCCCLGELSCEDACSRRRARRTFTSGIGYGIGRSLYR